MLHGFCRMLQGICCMVSVASCKGCVAWFLLQAACGCLLCEPSDEAVLLSEKTTARSTALDSGETGREPCALFAATGLQLRNGCTAASSCTYV
jgi:hypothetical protein